MRSPRPVVTAGVALLLLAAGCTEPESPTPSASGSSAVTAPSEAPSRCPNSQGGQCRGPLPAGVHTTSTFQPALTYTVPAGWDNQEDLAGNFLLLPPGADLGGVDAGTSDYVGVYASVRAAGGCAGEVGPRTGPTRLAAAIRADPDLRVSNVGPAEVGGLVGVVMDVELAPEVSSSCPSFGGGPAVPLILGEHATSMEHAVIDDLTMRLYLLARGDGTLAIEVDDVHQGRHLDAYSSVVQDFDFAD